MAAPAVALPMGMPLSSADPANWHSEYWLQAEKSEELKTAIRSDKLLHTLHIHTTYIAMYSIPVGSHAQTLFVS